MKNVEKKLWEEKKYGRATVQHEFLQWILCLLSQPDKHNRPNLKLDFLQDT